jgi:hypothetical protein
MSLHIKASELCQSTEVIVLKIKIWDVQHANTTSQEMSSRYRVQYSKKIICVRKRKDIWSKYVQGAQQLQRSSQEYCKYFL